MERGKEKDKVGIFKLFPGKSLELFRPSLNSLITLLKREIAESLLGVKLGAGEGLLPSARTLWMPPRGPYTPQEVDRQQ